jgi:protein-disulfide isomerase
VTKTLNTTEREPFLSRRVMLGAAILATAGLAASLIMSHSSQTETAASQRNKPKRNTADLMKPGPLAELSLGKADAPVTIVEYASMTCPHCAEFHNKVLPVLKKKYIDTGKVRLVFREFPTNAYSIIAAMAMRCVPPEKAQPLISAIFSRQREWMQAKSIPEIRDKLYPLAQQVGVSSEAFNACVPSGDKLTTPQQQKIFTGLNSEVERAHQGFGVRQTPTFFVNTTRLAGATIEDFDKALAPLLNR